MKYYISNSLILPFALALALCCPQNCLAQTKMKSVLGMAFVPQLDQNKEQQDKDDLECHRVAKIETGIDPVYLPEAIKSKPKKNKVITLSKVGKAPEIPTDSGVNDKPKKRDAGEAAKGKKRGKDKKEAKERAAAIETQREEDLNRYKEVYVSCMQEKGYKVW